MLQDYDFSFQPSLERERILAFCRERLAHFKCPTRVVFEEVPKTSTGKIQKFTLRQMIKEA